jgi:hypothetical protein
MAEAIPTASVKHEAVASERGEFAATVDELLACLSMSKVVRNVAFENEWTQQCV